MKWFLSDRADPAARQIADRHYNRQKIGATQFVPPGRCLVLAREDAFWVTSFPFAEFVKHRWAGAWVCSAFRNEGAMLSSDLIRDAVAVTTATWTPPPQGRDVGGRSPSARQDARGENGGRHGHLR